MADLGWSAPGVDADAVGLRCGLVADTARNVPLYQRCGFQVIQDAIGPDRTTSLWTMRTTAERTTALICR